MASLEELEKSLLPLLATANLVYLARLCPEDLEVLAGVFAEALADENLDDIERAFSLYAKQGKRFPTPAHILELLPECRVMSRAHVGLPMETCGKRTPGCGKLVYRAFKGDMEVKRQLDELVKRECHEARQ